MPELTPSARAFVEALKHPVYGPKIRARIHRVSISRFAHGQRRPDIDTARWLQDETKGFVPMEGWAKALRPLAADAHDDDADADQKGAA